MREVMWCVFYSLSCICGNSFCLVTQNRPVSNLNSLILHETLASPFPSPFIAVMPASSPGGGGFTHVGQAATPAQSNGVLSTFIVLCSTEPCLLVQLTPRLQ